MLDDAAVERLRASATALGSVDVEFFGENLGHGGGHGRLAAARDGDDAILVLNPDLLLAPTALRRLVDAFEPGIGAVELRQLPLEHAKEYDPATGRTEWAAGAGLLVSRAAFDAVGGFDHESFPMYGDDVDLSWRLRAAAYGLRVEPRAVGYHAKRLTDDGGWAASDFEWVSGYRAEVAMLAKWRSADAAEARLAELRASDDPRARTAAAELDALAAAGTPLPATRTDGSGVARPETPGYTETRYRL